MALNFPDSPTLNQVYTDTTSGFSYKWNGTVWISYEASTTRNIQELDDISASFNGVTDTFTLAVGGVSVYPASVSQLLINIGGIPQNPSNDFYISGSDITFTTAPSAGLSFFGTILGTSVPVGVSTVGDVYRQQSYTVTGTQTVFSFGSGYTVGFLEVYRNGVRLTSGVDFTATNGTSFTLTTAANNGDVVEAVGYVTGSIVTVAGNVTTLTVNTNAQILGITTTSNLVVQNSIYTSISTTATSKTLVNREICTVLGAGLTVTLPASPSAGWEVGVGVGGTFTNTQVAGNGANIMGLAENLTLDVPNVQVGFVYVNVSQGWRVF